MSCMKCGRETPEGQVFCLTCLEGMAQYPVDQDAPIQLPRRETAAPIRKPPRRRTPSPAERVVTLTRRVRLLTAGLIAAVLLCGALGYLSFYLFTNVSYPRGQNYTTVTQTSPPVTSGPVSSGE